MALAACGDGAQGPCVNCTPPPPPPTVESSEVVPGPHNVLSAIVRSRVTGADSVRVRFGAAGGPLDSMSPAAATVTGADSLDLPVLGLLPGADYEFEVVAYGGGDSVAGVRLPMHTGSLPVDLPTFAAGGIASPPGYVVLATGGYGLVIDNTGRVVWYRHLDWGPTLNFQAQPNGSYATSPIGPPTDGLAPWIELDPLGNVLRRVGCARGLTSRFHEMMVETDGSFWVMCDETRTLDLTAIGGVAGAAVTGTVLQHLDPGGALLWEWSVWDHFALTDLDPARRTGPSVNWTHGNAFELDGAGHVLLSFRSLNEITKVDLATGSVLWRMGGLANQFTFDPSGVPFQGQHGLRMTGPSGVQLLDNLGEPGGSRGERYQLNEVARTATLIGTYASSPSVTAALGGSSQALENGDILVAYGNGDRVQEYNAGGQVVWEIHGSPDYVFRAQRIPSLYHPGVGAPR